LTTGLQIDSATRPGPRRTQRLGHAGRAAVSTLAAVSVLLGLGLALGAKDKPATYTITAPPRPDFSGLDWLVGEWTGKTAGKDAKSQGDLHLTAAYEFDKRFMVLREEISLPATKTAPAVKESWMGILTGRRADGSFVMQVYSSTGFVTTYAVTLDSGAVYFNQQGGDQPPAGWLFRRVLEHTNPAEMSETVRVAPPDEPFFDYYTARLTRTPAGGGSPAAAPAAAASAKTPQP